MREKMPVPETDLLRNIFRDSLDELLSTDRQNISDDVHEINLCARLSLYLQQNVQKAGLENYFADVEYNRNACGKIKTVSMRNPDTRESKIFSVRCDVLLHGRGGRVPHENLLAVEMKKRGTNSIALRRKEQDIQRLKALTEPLNELTVFPEGGGKHPKHVCEYKLGYFIEVCRKSKTLLLIEFLEGEEGRREIIAF